MLEVVAAMIRDGEKFLICQRPAGKNCAFRESCPSVEFWRGMGECIDGYADSVTLQDLARDCPPCSSDRQE